MDKYSGNHNIDNTTLPQCFSTSLCVHLLLCFSCGFIKYVMSVVDIGDCSRPHACVGVCTTNDCMTTDQADVLVIVLDEQAGHSQMKHTFSSAERLILPHSSFPHPPLAAWLLLVAVTAPSMGECEVSQPAWLANPTRTQLGASLLR